MTIYEIEQEVINFHNKYENNAKKYGYETRKDTKELDLDSPNGRTMIATVFEILQPYTEKIEKLEEENERLKEDITTMNDYIGKIQKENNILKENAEHNDKVVDKAKWNEMIYKSRIEKAIEFIEEELTFYITIGGTDERKLIGYNKAFDELLKILQGSDKDD